MANTTWSTTDKSGGVTLSGGNLIATNTATTGWVRAIDKQVTGKFYWECKPTSWASNNTGIGVCPDSTASPSGATAAGLTAVFKSGNIYVDAVNTGSSLGARAVNDVISVAFDFSARLVWYRAAPSGNWNGNASANPATGVGGILVPIVGVGIPGFPLATFGINTDAITANFGDTAFVGAVPSGYTSGFTAASNTVLLVHCDGSNGSTTFTDVSPSGHSLSVSGGAAVTVASPRFGTGSVDFSGNVNGNITVAGPTDFNFGSGQFTVEAWAYFLTTPSGVQAVLAQFGGTTNLGWFFGTNTGTLAFFYSTTGTDNPSVGAAFSPTLNQWYHLAADRDASNVLRVYANGAVVASATVSSAFFASTRPALIGNDGGFVRGFPGKLDEIRITRGTARYGGAFTPPTAPFELDAIPTNAIASQALAEHWLTTSPQAQITQVILEHWMSVAEGVPVVPSLDTRVMVLA